MNIKELRKKLGLSQQELADKTGIPKARIGQWELGNGNPKADDSKLLAKFFVENGVLEDQREIKYVEYDMGAAIKKMEAISEVSLLAIAEVLAKVNDRPATVVLSELQDLINKRLNS